MAGKGLYYRDRDIYPRNPALEDWDVHPQLTFLPWMACGWLQVCCTCCWWDHLSSCVDCRARSQGMLLPCWRWDCFRACKCAQAAGWRYTLCGNCLCIAWLTYSSEMELGRTIKTVIPALLQLGDLIPLSMHSILAPRYLTEYGLPSDLNCSKVELSDRFFDLLILK